MQQQIGLIGLITGGILFISTSALASSFNLKAWERFGDVEIVNSNLANLSNNALLNDDFGRGLDSIYNFSSNPAVDNYFFDLEKELGLPPRSLDSDSNNFEYAYEGSGLKSLVEVKTGAELFFDWNFLTNERPPLAQPDYGFFFVNQTVYKLADFNDVSGISTGSNYSRETGLQTYSYKFPSSGSYHIGFGVVDIADYNVSSGLSVGNLSLTVPEPKPTKVPEPNSLIGLFSLLALGVSQFGHRDHKLRKKT